MKKIIGILAISLSIVSCTGMKSTTPSSTQSNYSTNSTSIHTTQTGPRGGTYYINSKGNKTYTKKR